MTSNIPSQFHSPQPHAPAWLALLFAAGGSGILLYLFLALPSDSIVIAGVSIALTLILLTVRGLSGRPFYRKRLGLGRIIRILIVLVFAYFESKLDIPTWLGLLLIALILTYAWLQDNGKVP